MEQKVKPTEETTDFDSLLKTITDIYEKTIVITADICELSEKYKKYGVTPKRILSTIEDYIKCYEQNRQTNV